MVSFGHLQPQTTLSVENYLPVLLKMKSPEDKLQLQQNKKKPICDHFFKTNLLN